MAHTCNPSTRVGEGGGSGAQGHPWLHKFEVILSQKTKQNATSRCCDIGGQAFSALASQDFVFSLATGSHITQADLQLICSQQTVSSNF